MPYLQFIGRAVDPCTVILLTSLDELPMVNEAPYPITTNPGGYSIDTSIKKFGTGAFGGGSSGAVHRIDFTGQPGGGVKGNGSLQIEFWYQRTGGTGAQAFGNQWDTDFYLEFDDGTWVQFVIGNASYFAAPNYRRTLYIAVSSAVSGYDEYRTTDIDFMPDDDFHAIRFAMDGAGAFSMLVDGAIVDSGTLTATVPAGARIVDLAWGDVRTGQRMDEARVILGAADLGEYTPATGAWIDATCGSDTESPPEATLLLHFDGANLSTAFIDSSPNSIAFTALGHAHIDTADSIDGVASGKFDGTGDRVESGAEAALTITGDFTLEGWVKTSFSARFFSIEHPDGTQAIFLASGGGKLVGPFSMSSPTVLADGAWHHVALSRKTVSPTSHIYRIFVDGNMEVELDMSTIGISHTTAPKAYAGGTPSTGHLFGRLDQWRLIVGQCIYTASFTPPTPPLT